MGQNKQMNKEKIPNRQKKKMIPRKCTINRCKCRDPFNFHIQPFHKTNKLNAIIYMWSTQRGKEKIK